MLVGNGIMEADPGRHRFFIEGVAVEVHGTIDLAPLAHQLRNVLRLAPGSTIILLDDSGASFPTRIEVLDERQAAGLVLDRVQVGSEPCVELTLYQCALKRDRFEWVLQKGVELGVRRFVPVVSSRTVVRPSSRLLDKYDRWRAIVREAAEQSGRGRLPVLSEPLTWDQAVNQGGGLRLMPWEEAGSCASGVDFGAADVRTASLLIGPEGGISAEEARAAIDDGWKPVSLGPRVLRAETAAIAAVAVVMHLAGDLG